VRRSAAVEALVRRGSDTPPQAEIERTMASAPLTAGGAAILAAERLHVLPEAYLYGLAFAEMKSHVRASFLRGRYSARGFRTFFLWSFILKTPLVTLAAIAAAVVLALRRRDPWSSEVAFLLVPAGLYTVASVVSGINIGHRHLLPVYPFLFVLCGRLARETRRPPWALLTAIAVGSSLVFSPPWKPQAVYPHYLAYFNELAGGPRRGYLSMVDSNLDWGQDLKSLRDWLATREIREPINLCYFGMADPRYYGIAHVNLPGGYVFEPTEPFASARVPGYLAISATNLQGVYMSSEERDGWRRLLASARLVDTGGHSIFVYALGG